MGMARLFGLCFALLFASSVSAANIIDLGPSDYRSYGSNGAHTGGGVRSSFGQTVRIPPAGASLSVTRNAVIPYGSIANGLRNFTRVNPSSVAASAAVTGLFFALDWAFDDDQWSKPGYEYGPEDPDNIYWVRQGLSDPRFASPEDMCRFYGEEYDGAWQLHSTSYELYGTNYRNVTCIGTFTYQGGAPFESTLAVGSRYGSTCTAPYQFVPSLGACAIQSYVPLDESDWSELESFLPSAPASEVARAASDTQRRIGNPLPGYQDQTITGPSSFTGPETTSTSTDPVTGDTIVTTTNTTTNISYGDTTITTSDTTTTTTYQNGQETGTTVTTETPGELPVSSGGGASGDWPGFCDWASVVCDWLDWTREDPPPEQDLPQVIDDDFYQEKEISFGSKSCPEPYQISLAPFMDTNVEVSFQPLCDFAGLIYYMVMAASYIIAAYISIGVARA